MMKDQDTRWEALDVAIDALVGPAEPGVTAVHYIRFGNGERHVGIVSARVAEIHRTDPTRLNTMIAAGECPICGSVPAGTPLAEPA